MKTFKPCCLSILLIFFLAQLPLQLTANTIGASEEGTKPLIEALKELSEKFQVFFT
jgi:hypothetical protein